MTTPQRPADYAEGLGELIRAHRVYVGLSQRAMAARLGKDRRDYQRIENGRDACPPGLLGQVEAMSDQFDTAVDTLINHAAAEGGTEVLVDTDPRWEWERNVAGRAALIASTDPHEPPRVVLRTASPSQHNPSQVG